MYLSEALSGHYPFELSPRLHSLRSLSLGLLRVCLFEAPCVIPHLLIWMRSLHGSSVIQCRGGVYPHPPSATVT